MKKLLNIMSVSVFSAPVIFTIYYMSALVCAPRAILSSAMFGLAPLGLTFLALRKGNEFWFHSALFILVLEMISTPVIMIGRLGWEKCVNDRLLAFFTFEGFAVLELFLVLLLLTGTVKSRTTSALSHA